MRIAAATGLALVLMGCAHPLDVRNLDQYEKKGASLEPLEQGIAVGLIAIAPDDESEVLVEGIGGALGKHAARVYFPYRAGGSNSAPVDVVARIGVKPTYEGSGWNFLVNFPGFLVFAPAWHGYIYGIDYEIDVQLTRAADGGVIDSWKIPVSLDIRHSSMARTWTQVSWFEWGAIALVSGIVFTRYNPDLTDLVVDEVKGPLGDRIATDIVRRLNSDAQLWASLAPAMAPSSAPAAGAPVPQPAPMTMAAAMPVAMLDPPPPAPAPVAAPVTAALSAGPLAIGARARLRPGAVGRQRAMPDADIAKALAGDAPLTLKASVRNNTGTWWYVSAPRGSGWVLESDLEAPTP